MGDHQKRSKRFGKMAEIPAIKLTEVPISALLAMFFQICEVVQKFEAT